MSEYNKSVFSGSETQVKRPFCFGCDEDRCGLMLTQVKTFEGIPTKYEEKICEGCDYNLNLIRPFIIPVIQHESHNGKIWWRIPKAIYENFETSLKAFREYNSPHQDAEDEQTVILGANDTGYGSKESIDTLLEKLSLIKAILSIFDKI